jgi:hypothetical protein
MNKQENTREILTNFVTKVEKEGIMPQSTINMLKYALESEKDKAIDDFVEWLYEGEDIPEVSALATLNRGNCKYFEHFPPSHDSWDDLLVTVPYHASDIDDEGNIIKENLDYEDEICNTIQDHPDIIKYGFSIYSSQGETYVTTDFNSDGDHGSNPIIFEVSFNHVRVYDIEVKIDCNSSSSDYEQIVDRICDLIDEELPGYNHSEVCVDLEGLAGDKYIISEYTETSHLNIGKILAYVIVTSTKINEE